METNIILEGDCLQELKDLPNESVDSIVTDPPYGLKFMGKSWDYDVPSVEIWKECFRVLKSGGHLLSFSGTRTYHRMACNIEDAGFEIRDMISWIYGSGFPKSMNVGKQIAKINGDEIIKGDLKFKGGTQLGVMNDDGWKPKDVYEEKVNNDFSGIGTTLKPACEPIVLARKPISEKTIALNVLKYGTGGLNIDACRIGNESIKTHGGNSGDKVFGKYAKMEHQPHNGRFPANFIHDGSPEVLAEFEKAGISKSVANSDLKLEPNYLNKVFGKGMGGLVTPENQHTDTGTPARFFKTCEFTEEDFEYAPFVYFPKASKSERNMGIEGYELKENIPEDIKSLIYKHLNTSKTNEIL